MGPILITFTVSFFWLQGLCQHVTQLPATSWSYVSKSAEMNCSHNRDANHNQMYWFRQRHGETMTLIVYALFGMDPDYGKSPADKYSAVRPDFKSGSLTVKNVQPEDSAVYFCAVKGGAGAEEILKLNTGSPETVNWSREKGVNERVSR
ncbi:unnamed protein product [Pleuronectes platessa]|uniref:Ig-like domain-containing protein n=1 Tax=Pleuronectes platessa TaxID=8262 RepID=A0A9N7Z4Y5_PLEPL|nr:unnamed protein product [Pleuronectes platessa]